MIPISMRQHTCLAGLTCGRVSRPISENGSSFWTSAKATTNPPHLSSRTHHERPSTFLFCEYRPLYCDILSGTCHWSEDRSAEASGTQRAILGPPRRPLDTHSGDRDTTSTPGQRCGCARWQCCDGAEEELRPGPSCRPLFHGAPVQRHAGHLGP